MGYEYESRLPRELSQNEIEEIFAALLLNQDYELVVQENDKLFLRFADLPPEEIFPRDLDIYCRANSVLVAFHRGERKGHQKFLHLLAVELRHRELSSAFEEI